MEPTLNIRGGGTVDDEEEDAAITMSPEPKKARGRRPGTADLPTHGRGLFQAGSTAAAAPAPKEDVTSSDDSLHAESDDDVMSAVDAMANLSSPSGAPTTGMSAVAVDRPSDNESESSKSTSSDEPAEPSRVSVLLEQYSTGNTLNFRELDNSELGIDLEAREKYMHHQLNPHNPAYGTTEDPTFDDPFLATWYVAIKEFLETMVTMDYRDKEGNPLLWNVPSLPVGKSKDEPVVILFFNYITSEEGYPLLKSRMYCSYTATHSDHTIIPNTIEMPRRALGDDVFYGLCLGDVVPFAYWHESSPEEHCEVGVLNAIMEEWREVLEVLLKAKGVKFAIGAGTAQDRFAKIFGKPFKEIIVEYPDKFVSAAKEGEAHASPPHPQALYDIRKMSNMGKKLGKAKIFYSEVMNIFDPNAPGVVFFDNFEDEFSALFDLCRRAHLDGCSHGGSETWRRKTAALQRRENGEPKQKGDEKLLKAWDNFVDSWDVAGSKGGTETWRRKTAALQRRENGEPKQKGDDKLLKAWDNWDEARPKGGTNNWELTKAALHRKKKNEPLLVGDKERIEKWEAFHTARKEYQDMVIIRNKLASHFIIAGGHNGYCRSEVANHADFEDFKTRSGLVDEEEALAAVQEVADGFDYTFETNLAGLKEYRQMYPRDIVQVNGHSILVVDQMKAGKNYRGLSAWLRAMIGYSDKFLHHGCQYGLKVCNFPDSAQYKALEELNVTFDPDLYTAAMEQHTKDKVNSKTSNATNRNSFMSSLGL